MIHLKINLWRWSNYRICTRCGFPYEEGYLVRWFINGLDSNFDNAHILLQNGALHWFTMTLNEVIQEVTEIRLNRQLSGTWTMDGTAVNLAEKQGAKHPDTSTSDNSITIDPDVPTYCYKPLDLTFKEIQSLLRQYSYPLYRHNGHPLHECSSLTKVYDIKLKSPSVTNQPTWTSFSQTP